MSGGTGQRNGAQSAFGVLLALWTLFIFYGTTIPFDLRLDATTLREGWAQAYPLPWTGPSGGRPSIPDLLANVLLFLPWGLFLAAGLARRRWSASRAVATSVAGGLLLSLTVEILQLASPTRLTASSDLLTNGLGAGLGAGLGWTLAGPLWSRIAPLAERELHRAPLRLGAGVMVVLVLITAAAPFHPSLDVDDLKASVKTARPIPFGDPIRGEAPPESWGDRAAEVLWWSLAAGVFAAAWRRHRSGAWIAATLASTVILAAVAEAGQIFVVGRVSDATSVLMAAAGAVVGVALWTATESGSRGARLRLGLAIWVAAVTMGALEPWRFTTAVGGAVDPLYLLPFYHHFLQTNAWALADTLVQALTFFPLGLYLVLTGSRCGPWTAAALGVAIMGGLEVAQIFAVGRTADVTDALVAGAGAWVATWLFRRLPGSSAFGVDRREARC